MSPSLGTVFSRLSRIPLKTATFHFNNSSLRLSCVRPLALTSQLEGRSKEDDRPVDDRPDEPIRFSTSKASHRVWKVEGSMGSQFERPWRKVLPLSLAITVFLLWCVFRGQTAVDQQLDRSLLDTLPGLRPNEEDEEEDEEKPS